MPDHPYCDLSEAEIKEIAERAADASFEKFRDELVPVADAKMPRGFRLKTIKRRVRK